MKAYVLVAPSDEEMQTTTAKAREHLGLTYGVFDDARTAWYDAQRSRTEDRIRPQVLPDFAHDLADWRVGAG